MSKQQVQAAMQNLIDAVDTLFVTQQTRPGETMHFAATGGHESAIARGLLPMLNGTHLGRLVRLYGRELISEYR